jgi:hypothetical protein
MRISKRAQRRRGNLDDGWEEYLFKFCNRLGVFVCFPVDMHFLMDDPAERDRLIREIWDQHGGDLLEKWAANCHDGETPAVIKHLEKYADTAAYLYYLPPQKNLWVKSG